MPEPLGELLTRAAAAPRGPLDVEDLSRRARRIVRNRRIGTAAMAVALIVPAGVLGTVYLVPETAVDFAPGSVGLDDRVTEQPSERSTPAVAPSALPQESPEPDGGAGLGTPAVGPQPTLSPTPSGRSTATVVISDPPGAPERRPDLPGDTRHPSIVLTLVLDRTELTQGQKINGWLEARNTGDDAVDLGKANCWALWGLYKDRKWVGGQDGTVCETAHPRATLAPGQVLRVPMSWDATAGNDRDKGQEWLAPGRYEAAAALRVTGTKDTRYQGVWYAPVVSVTVRQAPPQS